MSLKEMLMKRSWFLGSWKGKGAAFGLQKGCKRAGGGLMVKVPFIEEIPNEGSFQVVLCQLSPDFCAILGNSGRLLCRNREVTGNESENWSAGLGFGLQTLTLHPAA